MAPASKPVIAPKAQKRKYAPGDGTPRQRKIILMGVVICIVGVFLIPGPAPEEVPVPKKTPTIAAPPPRAKKVKLEQAIEIPEVIQTALPPVDTIPISTPTSKEQSEGFAKALVDYFAKGTPEQKVEAYKKLLEGGPVFIDALPQMIETEETALLTYLARAAKELKVVKAIPSLIKRLETREKKRIAGVELFEALSSFDDKVGQAFILASLQGKDSYLRNSAWQALGGNMNADQLALVLKTIGEGGDQSDQAAIALGKFGANPLHARQAVASMRTLLDGKDAKVRHAAARALSITNSEEGFALMSMLLTDGDPKVRALALTGIAQSPGYKDSVIEALNNDADLIVRESALLALCSFPNEAAIPQLIKLLDDENLRGIAHKALIATTARDLGRYSYDWQAWYSKKLEPKTPALKK
jgi:HEAT repeat protein